MQAALRALAVTAAAGAGAALYAGVVEPNWFTLRRHEVPVLAPGAAPLRILHLSDVHLTPGRHRLMSWIRSLDALDPDLVVNTGDSIAHKQAVQPFLAALGPLLERPGVFVYGSNDLYSPIPKNPARYLWRTSAKDNRPEKADLPWRELGAAMSAAGSRPGTWTSRWAGCTTRTSAGTVTTTSPGPPTPPPTCGSVSCTRPSPG